jgi:tRNA threonylcarbamoyladenosine biosynthesis protein TsaB
MLVITIRTDNPTAEVALYKNGRKIDEICWEAHRTLADSIHLKLKELITNQSLGWVNIQAIVVFKGPGSFTGLRIGITVANALAFSLGIPIVGTQGENWQITGIKLLNQVVDEKIVLPEYGGDVKTTSPKK